MDRTQEPNAGLFPRVLLVYGNHRGLLLRWLAWQAMTRTDWTRTEEPNWARYLEVDSFDLRLKSLADPGSHLAAVDGYDLVVLHCQTPGVKHGMDLSVSAEVLWTRERQGLPTWLVNPWEDVPGWFQERPDAKHRIYDRRPKKPW